MRSTTHHSVALPAGHHSSGRPELVAWRTIGYRCKLPTSIANTFSNAMKAGRQMPLNAYNTLPKSTSATILIPILNNAIQASTCDLTSFLRMPLRRHHRAITRLELMVQLTALPVPKAQPTSGVTAHQELTIRRNVDINRIARIVVSSERFLAVLSELVGGGVYDHLVITALVRHVLAAGMGRCADHRVHVGLCDELDGNGNTVFPGTQRFVIGGGDESAVFIDEGNGVDRTQMVVVFLHHLLRARVELYDLFVRHTRKELVRVRWVEPDHVRNLARREPVQAFACFGIPELHVAVIGCGEEVLSCGCECDVGDGLGVAVVGAQKLSLVVDIPDLPTSALKHNGGQEEVNY
jgi:hypothetical protein